MTSADGGVQTAGLLDLTAVTAGYARTVVLRDVNLAVGTGKVVALVGVNGAGKTTTLRAISGLIRATAGSILFDGTEISALPAYERARLGICHITDSRAIFPDMTVTENICLQVGGKRRLRKQAMEQATSAFPRLADRRDQIASTLSGGEQQMLALARAYVTNPKLLLLDELSMGLAPVVIDSIYLAIERLVAEGLSILIVEQYIKRILPLADEIYVMNHGGVAAHGPTSEIAADNLIDMYLAGGRYTSTES
jgi:branched-chain amino acid transport system ATP-binding protein